MDNIGGYQATSLVPSVLKDTFIPAAKESGSKGRKQLWTSYNFYDLYDLPNFVLFILQLCENSSIVCIFTTLHLHTTARCSMYVDHTADYTVEPP